MGCDDARLDFIAMLATRARSFGRADLNLGFIQPEGSRQIGIEHGNGYGRGLHTAAFFSWRDSLPAVAAGFILKKALRTLACKDN